jgi:excisionase family DNA binding protein
MTNTNHNSPGPALEPAEQYISKKEVAFRLGRDVRTIDNWMREGKLPFYKIGRAVAFRWSEVQSFLVANFRVCRKPRV